MAKRTASAEQIPGFDAWLLAQASRNDDIGELAASLERVAVLRPESIATRRAICAWLDAVSAADESFTALEVAYVEWKRARRRARRRQR